MNAPVRLSHTYLDSFKNGDYVNMVTNAIVTLEKMGKLGNVSIILDKNVLKNRAKEFLDLGLNIPTSALDDFFVWDQNDPNKLKELIRRAIALFKAVTYAESDGVAIDPNKPYSLDQIVRIEHTPANDLYKAANPSTTLPTGSGYDTYELAFKENKIAAIKSTSFGMFQIIPGRFAPNIQGFADLLYGKNFNPNNWRGRDALEGWQLLLGTNDLEGQLDPLLTGADKILASTELWKTVESNKGPFEKIFAEITSQIINFIIDSTKINWNLYALATIIGNYLFYKIEDPKYISSLWYAYVPTMYVFWGSPETVATNIDLSKHVSTWPDSYHSLHNNSATFNAHVGQLNMKENMKKVVNSAQWPKVAAHNSFEDCCSYDSKLLWAFIQFYNNPDLVTLNPNGDRYSNYGGGNQHITTTVYTYMGAQGKVMRDSLTQKLSNPLYSTVLNKDEKDKNEKIKNKILESIYSYVNEKVVNSDENRKINVVDDVILPLNVNITIDGISGLNIGDPIELDFLPDIYSNNTYLIITGLNYEIGPSNNWATNMSLSVKLKGKRYD